MNELLEGQKVKIFFNVENERKEMECYVKEVFSDRVSLTLPKGIMQYVDYLGEGMEIFMKVFTLAGMQMFESIILNSPLECDFMVEYEKDALLIQRREYSRFKTETELIIYCEEEEIEATTVNISGGGLKFYCKKPLNNQELLSGTVCFHEEGSVDFKGKILTDNVNEPSEEYAIMFTDIKEEDRNKLIKICSKLQFKTKKMI